MSVWWILDKRGLGWSFSARNGSRVAAFFTGSGRESKRGTFFRYEGPGEVPRGSRPWRRNPDGWIELLPRVPVIACTFEEAKRITGERRPGLEDGSSDEHYVHRPHVPPRRPTLVNEIEHPIAVAKALILANPGGDFEVTYRVYAPDGRYFPAASPSIGEIGWEWGVTWVRGRDGSFLRTMADCLVDAETIARQELDVLVNQDPEIKRR